jgi:hypothetical protein
VVYNGGIRKEKYDLAPVMCTALLAAIKDVEKAKVKASLNSGPTGE